MLASSHVEIAAAPKQYPVLSEEIDSAGKSGRLRRNDGQGGSRAEARPVGARVLTPAQLRGASGRSPTTPHTRKDLPDCPGLLTRG